MNFTDSFPFVDVIVVLWKSVPYLETLFDGLVNLDYPHDRMTVHFVDNSPGDGSLDETRRLMTQFSEKLPPIEIHEPGKNTGFSGGNNLAVKRSIERGHEYSYLLNYDATFEPAALREAIAVAEADQRVGSVQSLMVLQQNPDEVNSRGNAIHFLGFGYCDGYHERRSDVRDAVVPIGYASGAAVLFRNAVLSDVGLLDETLFAYHEDLDLGWRILLAGYRNVLAPRSVVRHRYDFSRSVSKWFWMERNRGIVVLKNYRIATIVVLAIPLFVTDIGILTFSIMGGFWREKLRAMAWFWKPSSWAYLLRGRRDVARIRKVPDRHVLSYFVPVIAYQEFERATMTHVINPMMRLAFVVMKAVVQW